jgi:hypothetical protein
MSDANTSLPHKEEANKEPEYLHRSPLAIDDQDLLDGYTVLTNLEAEYIADREREISNYEKIAALEMPGLRLEDKIRKKAAIRAEELRNRPLTNFTPELDSVKAAIDRFDFGRHPKPSKEMVVGAAWHWHCFSTLFRESVAKEPKTTPLEIKNILDDGAKLLSDFICKIRKLPSFTRLRISADACRAIPELLPLKNLPKYYTDSDGDGKSLIVQNISELLLEAILKGVQEERRSLRVRRGPRGRQDEIVFITEALACTWYALTGRKPTSTDKTGNFISFSETLISVDGINITKSEIMTASVALAKRLKRSPLLLQPDRSAVQTSSLHTSN